MPVVGTDAYDPSLVLFHGLLASMEQSIRTAGPRFDQVLIVMILPSSIRVHTHDSTCPSSRKRQNKSLRRRMYICSNGILTIFPFLQTY